MERHRQYGSDGRGCGRGRRRCRCAGKPVHPSDFSPAQVKDYDAIAFGCPAMGAEQLEDFEFEPLFLQCAPELNGKDIALFGSYGWGDGEWMQTWEDQCKDLGAHLVSNSVIANEAPDDTALAACRDLGTALA